METNSPAFEGGLRSGDLITHVNGTNVQGLVHSQVIALILAEGNKVTIRAVPLDNTTIKMGGRKRGSNVGKMAKRGGRKKHQRGKTDDKKRRTSLFRRLSSRRAEQHLGSPLTPSRSFSSLNRSLSSGDSQPASPTRSKSPPSGRLWSPASDTSPPNSSQSSSPSSSTPNSPASTTPYSRPSSLGLKHNKLQAIKSPHRRKSVHNIPLSPLARTPSPSMASTSPTRSPSPLTLVHGPVGHPPGISNMTQTYNPSSQSSPSPSQSFNLNRRSGARPKSCEPGSPLLRRALSPDRLHPNSAEKQHRKSSSWNDKKDDKKSSGETKTAKLEHRRSLRLEGKSLDEKTGKLSGSPLTRRRLSADADQPHDKRSIQPHDKRSIQPHDKRSILLSKKTDKTKENKKLDKLEDKRKSDKTDDKKKGDDKKDSKKDDQTKENKGADKKDRTLERKDKLKKDRSLERKDSSLERRKEKKDDKKKDDKQDKK